MNTLHLSAVDLYLQDKVEQPIDESVEVIKVVLIATDPNIEDTNLWELLSKMERVEVIVLPKFQRPKRFAEQGVTFFLRDDSEELMDIVYNAVRRIQAGEKVCGWCGNFKRQCACRHKPD